MRYIMYLKKKKHKQHKWCAVLEQILQALIRPWTPWGRNPAAGDELRDGILEREEHPILKSS